MHSADVYVWRIQLWLQTQTSVTVHEDISSHVDRPPMAFAHDFIPHYSLDYLLIFKIQGRNGSHFIITKWVPSRYLNAIYNSLTHCFDRRPSQASSSTITPNLKQRRRWRRLRGWSGSGVRGILVRHRSWGGRHSTPRSLTADREVTLRCY